MKPVQGPYRVLVLGGYGFFGARLVERLAREPGLEILVAGRSLVVAEALCLRLHGTHQARAELHALALDANDPRLATRLKLLGVHAVVHTCGPFQGQSYHVAHSCIAAGVHYIDLADGRGFVAGISLLDEMARKAGVVVLSGASSVPALSSAVTDELARGLETVEHIDIGISPGNRTERGLATVRAVLGYCGQSIPSSEGGSSARPQYGWSGTWKHEYGFPVKERLLSPCDVPDLALLSPRYPGRPGVRFGAGLEVRLLHRGMNLLAAMAKAGLVSDWGRWALPLKWASDLFRWAGTDTGAMHVTVRGVDRTGQNVERTWELRALEGDGPFVPTLAATALVKYLAAGSQGAAIPADIRPGARPCVGVLKLADFEAQTQGLAITMGSVDKDASMYQKVMGSAFRKLAPELQRFHSLKGEHSLVGEVLIEPPETRLGRILGWFTGTPLKAFEGPMAFDLEAGPTEERWTRRFPNRYMFSKLSLKGSRLVERLGPAKFTFELVPEAGTLHMRLHKMSFLGVPCPSWLLPDIVAHERGKDGCLHFLIRVSVPLLGQVAGYRGHLEVPDEQ